jgi:hypothetical protein
MLTETSKGKKVWARDAHGSTISRLIDLGRHKQHEDTMRITPAVAREMLKYNTRNRPLSIRAVGTWAREMSAGNWEDSLTTLMFSDKGQLLDGQHRLHAIVQSNTTVHRAVVRFGLPAAAFDKIDVGSKRSNGDVFAIHGVSDPIIMASATKWIYLYTSQGRMSSTSMSPAHLDRGALYDLFTKFTDLPTSVAVANLFRKNRVPTPSIAAAAHYLFSKCSRAEADIFMRKIATGVGFSSLSDPALKVRDRLTREKLPSREVMALIINGWNAHRSKKGKIKKTSNDLRAALPRIYG